MKKYDAMTTQIVFNPGKSVGEQILDHMQAEGQNGFQLVFVRRETFETDNTLHFFWQRECVQPSLAQQFMDRVE